MYTWYVIEYCCQFCRGCNGRYREPSSHSRNRSPKNMPVWMSATVYIIIHRPNGVASAPGREVAQRQSLGARNMPLLRTERPAAQQYTDLMSDLVQHHVVAPQHILFKNTCHRDPFDTNGNQATLAREPWVSCAFCSGTAFALRFSV